MDCMRIWPFLMARHLVLSKADIMLHDTGPDDVGPAKRLTEFKPFQIELCAFVRWFPLSSGAKISFQLT